MHFLKIKYHLFSDIFVIFFVWFMSKPIINRWMNTYRIYPTLYLPTLHSLHLIPTKYILRVWQKAGLFQFLKKNIFFYYILLVFLFLIIGRYPWQFYRANNCDWCEWCTHVSNVILYNLVMQYSDAKLCMFMSCLTLGWLNGISNENR